jgi:hypothetical protein
VISSDSLALQGSPNCGRVHSKRPGDRGEGFAGLVAAGSVTGVGWSHLGPVDAPRHATGRKVARDRSPMDPELHGEVGERSPSWIGGDEPVDLGLVEAALNGTPNRFHGSRLLTSIGCARAAGSVSGGRV